MQRLKAALTIPAPAGRVWRIITDTHLWPVWGPSVKAVQCRDRFITSGSTGFVQTFFRLRFPFAVTDFIDETYWAWQVRGIKATGHRVERISKSQCRLIFDVPFFGVPYLTICGIALWRIRHLAKDQ
jgi:hypothetical protein